MAAVVSKRRMPLGADDVFAEALVDLEAIGQLGRRFHQIGPRQCAEPSVGLPHSHHGARHPGCQVSHYILWSRVLIRWHGPGS